MSNYCLLAICTHVLGNYFSLAARLSQWSMLVQLLLSLVMGASLVAGALLEILPLPILLTLLLGLGLLFRQQALQRFAVVDWYQLRPATQALKGKLS